MVGHAIVYGFFLIMSPLAFPSSMKGFSLYLHRYGKHYPQMTLLWFDGVVNERQRIQRPAAAMFFLAMIESLFGYIWAESRSRPWGFVTADSTLSNYM